MLNTWSRVYKMEEKKIKEIKFHAWTEGSSGQVQYCFKSLIINYAEQCLVNIKLKKMWKKEYEWNCSLAAYFTLFVFYAKEMN